MRISSTSQPPITPQSNSQPPYQSFLISELTIPTTSYSYSENEEKENEETELQLDEQMPATRKRARFVNVIGKQLYTKYYIIYYTYICLYNKLVIIIFSHSVDVKERELQNNCEPMMSSIYLLMKGLLCSEIMRVNQLQMVEHY